MPTISQCSKHERKKNYGMKEIKFGIEIMSQINNNVLNVVRFSNALTYVRALVERRGETQLVSLVIYCTTDSYGNLWEVCYRFDASRMKYCDPMK